MEEGRFSGVVSGFASDPDGAAIAVGYDGSNGATWISPNGTDWRPIPLQAAFEPVDGEATLRLRSAAHGDAGYVAVGESGPWAVILVSGDGLTWSRADSAPAHARVTIDSITGAGGRFVMFGHQRVPYRGIAWSAGDGRVWSEVLDPPLSTSSEVVTGKSGWLVPVAATPDPQDVYGLKSQYDLLWSADGRTWSVIDTPPSPGNSTMPFLIAVDDGFVAVTNSESGACHSDIWRTRNARSWDCIDTAAPNVDSNHWRFAASAKTIIGYAPTSIWAATLGD